MSVGKGEQRQYHMLLERTQDPNIEGQGVLAKGPGIQRKADLENYLSPLQDRGGREIMS